MSTSRVGSGLTQKNVMLESKGLSETNALAYLSVVRLVNPSKEDLPSVLF